jgi:hypothetical protein
MRCAKRVISIHIMPPSHSLRKHAGFLKTLCACNPTTQKSLLQAASPEVIDCLCEICFNILHGKVPLSSKQKSKLSTYKSSLRKLTKKSTPNTGRRKLLQKGGFIGALLGPLLKTVIAPLASSLLTA